MRLQGVLNASSWLAVTPAVVLAISNSDLGLLGLGAFGPPAETTLLRWLLLGVILAAGNARVRRRASSTILVVATVLSLAIVTYRLRDVRTDDVSFEGNGIRISATVYRPRLAGTHPAVVLVHGSAPLRRGFYSLWARQLARDGVVVLVPDKRGVGGTGGEFERNNNTSRSNIDLLAGDVSAAIDYAAQLAGVDTTRIGLLGLSQAGWVAPLAANRNPRARFLLMVTTPTVSVHEEGAWSRFRGDDERQASMSIEAAERVMDTVSSAGVDARVLLGSLEIPGLWLFGAEDNSIPSRKSALVLDSLRGAGKAFDHVVLPASGHLMFTRKGRLVPRVAPQSWRVIQDWLGSKVLNPT